MWFDRTFNLAPGVAEGKYLEEPHRRSRAMTHVLLGQCDSSFGRVGTAVGCGIFWQFPWQRWPWPYRIWVRGPSYGSGRDPDILAGRLWPAARSCKFHFPIQAPI